MPVEYKAAARNQSGYEECKASQRVSCKKFEQQRHGFEVHPHGASPLTPEVSGAKTAQRDLRPLDQVVRPIAGEQTTL